MFIVSIYKEISSYRKGDGTWVGFMESTNRYYKVIKWCNNFSIFRVISIIYLASIALTISLRIDASARREGKELIKIVLLNDYIFTEFYFYILYIQKEKYEKYMRDNINKGKLNSSESLTLFY